MRLRPLVVFASILGSLCCFTSGYSQTHGQTIEAKTFAQLEGEYQERLLIQKVELNRAQAKVTALTKKLAQVEAELAQQKLATRKQQQRLSALGLSSVQGQGAVSERLVEAVASAVQLSQEAKQRRVNLVSAQEQLLLLLNNQTLAASTRKHASQALEEVQLALKDFNSTQDLDAQTGVRYEVADYDSSLRLAILKSGADEGLRPGLRLQTIDAVNQEVQQLLVVDVRDGISGVIQLDQNAPQLVSGIFLQPVLEKISN